MISSKLSFALVAALFVAGAATARAAEDVTPEPTTEAPAPAPAPVEATETKSEFVARAPYFAGGGVFAIENTDTSSLSNSGGYDIRGGYGLHDNWDIEIQWQSLVSFDLDTVDPITGNKNSDLEARMLSFNGRWSPLLGRFQPYALMGMGWFNVQADRSGNEEHKSSFAMRFGLGLGTFITSRLGLTVEAGYILPLTGDLGGGHSFDLV